MADIFGASKPSGAGGGQPQSLKTDGQSSDQPTPDQLIGLGAGGAAAPQGGSGAGETIVDGSEASFAQDVIDASMQVPVIVDFWAPWCGPCKQLGPALEAAVTAAKGKVKLVKIDIDQNPGIAQQLRIQSIPTVYAFAGGRPVDGFQGALPESQLKEFVQKLAEAADQLGGGQAGAGEDEGAMIEQALEQADEALKQGDAATAAAIYTQVLERAPENASVLAKLANAYVKLGEAEAARQILAEIPDDVKKKPEIAADVQAVEAALELASKAEEAAGRIEDLRAKVAAEPADHQARFELAEAEAAVGDHEAAIDNLLEILSRNKDWNDGAARSQLLKIFEALGPGDERVVSGRRRLSSLLFS
ncbi:MAG: thioredoxin [Marivibrio sp.]|uniref:thioredoxin n=1 Tax=Marivibrio sp. TaxID=2039719 RepID=UPI0032EAB71D